MGCRGRCGPTTARPLRRTGPGAALAFGGLVAQAGIRLDRIDPGHPEQNGRHERFHRTLQDEAATPPAATLRQQQARFDRLRRNSTRNGPHEALGQQPPSRVLCGVVPAVSDAPRGSLVRRHARGPAGHATMGKSSGAATSSLSARRSVGEPWGGGAERGDWIVRFMHLEFGRIDRRTRRFTPAWHGRRPHRTAAALRD